ncbi:hypothetical protein Q9966_014722, partial [Columba livia]
SEQVVIDDKREKKMEDTKTPRCQFRFCQTSDEPSRDVSQNEEEKRGREEERGEEREERRGEERRGEERGEERRGEEEREREERRRRRERRGTVEMKTRTKEIRVISKVVPAPEAKPSTPVSRPKTPPPVPSPVPAPIHVTPPSAPAPPPPQATVSQVLIPPPSPAVSAAAGSKAPVRSVVTETVSTYVIRDESGNQIWICPGCNKPDDGSPMIGCDDCDDWYHWPDPFSHSQVAFLRVKHKINVTPLRPIFPPPSQALRWDYDCTPRRDKCPLSCSGDAPSTPLVSRSVELLEIRPSQIPACPFPAGNTLHSWGTQLITPYKNLRQKGTSRDIWLRFAITVQHVPLWHSYICLRLGKVIKEEKHLQKSGRYRGDLTS